jgi:type IV pilus assembly protein PilC
MIKAGESSGTLDVAFDDLNRSIEKENELRSKIRAALVYPALLMIMATAILIFLVTFALPKIAEVFSGGGFNPPLFSRVVFSVGLFFNHNLLLILGFLFVLIAGCGIFLFKTAAGKRFRTKFMSMLPVVRVLVKEIALQRFASTFSSLTRAGLPVVNALDITANAVGHADLSASLKRVAHDGIIRGLTLGDAFKRETVFPKTVTNLVAISEKAGHLDEILETLSEFYESEIDSSLKILISFLEPALLVVIGFVVALIALAIIVPIYQLVGQFS